MSSKATEIQPGKHFPAAVVEEGRVQRLFLSSSESVSSECDQMLGSKEVASSVGNLPAEGKKATGNRTWSGVVGFRTIQGAPSTRGSDGGTPLGLVCPPHSEAPLFSPRPSHWYYLCFLLSLDSYLRGHLVPSQEVWTKALWYIMMTVPLLCCFIINHPEIQL